MEHYCECQNLKERLSQLETAQKLLEDEAEWLSDKLDDYADFCFICTDVEKDEKQKDLWCIHQNGCTRTWRDFAKEAIKK